jgi:hypothetical protein
MTTLKHISGLLLRNTYWPSETLALDGRIRDPLEIR